MLSFCKQVKYSFQTKLFGVFGMNGSRLHPESTFIKRVCFHFFIIVLLKLSLDPWVKIRGFHEKLF